MLNTTLCIVASTVTAFFASQWLRKGKFDMVDVQNATLAGGVTIGAIADMALTPAVAILVGIAAGGLSCFGYAKIQPYLEEKWGVHDTCGINNLHGMPSILGGIFSVFGALNANKDSYGSAAGVGIVFAGMVDGDKFVKTEAEQALAQIAGVVVTLVISIVSGLITGWLANYSIFEPITDELDVFEDSYAFGVPDEYVCGVPNGDIEYGEKAQVFGSSYEMSAPKKPKEPCSPGGTPLSLVPKEVNNML